MEDIERIQNLINTYKIFSNVPIEENDIKALENIVKDYKELKKQYEWLELHEENMEKRYQDELDNSIPTSVIQNKILNPMKEEHNKAIKEFMKKEIPECIAGGEVAQTLGYFIGEIEELLKENKAYANI